MGEPGAAAPSRSGELSRDPEKHASTTPGFVDPADAALNLEFDGDSQPGRVIVRIGGELDMLTAPRLRDALLPIVATADADVVLDLGPVTFLGSNGLGVLVEVARQATDSGAALRLVAATKIVTRPITLTGLDEVLDLYESVDDLPTVAPRSPTQS